MWNVEVSRSKRSYIESIFSIKVFKYYPDQRTKFPLSFLTKYSFEGITLKPEMNTFLPKQMFISLYWSPKKCHVAHIVFMNISNLFRAQSMQMFTICIRFIIPSQPVLNLQSEKFSLTFLRNKKCVLYSLLFMHTTAYILMVHYLSIRRKFWTGLFSEYRYWNVEKV